MAESPAKANFEFPENGGNIFTVQYNPEKLQLDRAASWQEAKQQGEASGLEFQKTTPASLTMELIFDTSIDGKDVRKMFVDVLSNALLPSIPFKEEKDESGKGGKGKGKPIEKHRPPKVCFRWGEFSFLGVIKSLKSSYLLFSETGVPIRAKVNLVMQEVVVPKILDVGEGDSKGYNIPKVKLVQMQSGQTLSMIAGAAGTSAQVLADMNGIPNPLDVAAGTMLKVPFS